MLKKINKKNNDMKKQILMVITVVAVLGLNAQPQTVQGFNAGSYTENGLSVVLGQSFHSITAQNGYEVAEGVAQAQLRQEHYTATVNEGEGYNDHGFTYADDTPVGTYNDRHYEVHATLEGYDRLTTLVLKVLKVLNCGELVYDGDHHEYQTVAVAGYCWTKQNLYAEHYSDETTEIPDAMAYHSWQSPDEAANVSTYGRLYTWASAVGANADGIVTPDDNGYVQGICPNGWHIPTAEEKAALDAIPAEEIRTAELWVTPNANTNSTEFTALPAGKFNAVTNRFEGLGSQTDWWTVVPTTVDGVETFQETSLQLQYYCNTPLDGQPNAQDGLSVRCVKNE